MLGPPCPDQQIKSQEDHKKGVTCSLLMISLAGRPGGLRWSWLDWRRSAPADLEKETWVSKVT